jgi:MFS family permease
VRLDRDRLTRLTYAQLGTYGYFLYGFGPSVPLLRDDLGVSNAVGGLHGTALATGSVLAGLSFARLVARLGRAAVLRLGLAGLAAGVLVLCLAPVLPLTLLGALVCGLFGSFVVTGSIVVLGVRHGPAGPAAISEANAGAAGAGLVAPLLVGAGVSVGIGWRPGLLVAAVLAAVVWVVSRRELRVAGPDRTGATEVATTAADAAAGPASGAEAVGPASGAEAAGGQGGRDAPGRLPGAYWLAWAVLVACIGVEFCLTFWAADSLREHTGAGSAAATAGVTAIVAGMFAGRLSGGWVALRVRPGPLLLLAIATAAVGFGIFWASTAPVAALAGLVVCGVGVALQYPVGAAIAVAASAGRPDRAAAFMSLAAGLASGVAPFALGAVADQVGTHTAFLIVPGLLAVAAAGVLAGRQV